MTILNNKSSELKVKTIEKEVEGKTIDFNVLLHKEDLKEIKIERIKPLLRGRIHQIAFYKTLLLFIALIISNIFLKTFSIALVIYFLSQLLLYGVSYIYHTTNFKKEQTRRSFQRLDHTSIFILISGTQSSVFLSYVNDKTVVLALLITTWTISILGIIKVIVMHNIFEMLDVLFYIGHGVCVVPFFKKLSHVVKLWEFILFIVGGFLYIVGGIFFGTEWPNPWPKVFGFHEIFHILTVCANICFMVPVLNKYIVKLM